MTSKKDRNMIKDPEFGLDSRYTSKKESESEATALMEARLMRMRDLSPEQIVRARLRQLELRMAPKD